MIKLTQILFESKTKRSYIINPNIPFISKKAHNWILGNLQPDIVNCADIALAFKLLFKCEIFAIKPKNVEKYFDFLHFFVKIKNKYYDGFSEINIKLLKQYYKKKYKCDNEIIFVSAQFLNKFAIKNYAMVIQNSIKEYK